MSNNPSETTLTVSLMPSAPQPSAAAPSPSLRVYDFDFSGSNFEIDSSISEEERRFYQKMYPTVDIVNQRKVHCTVCRMHIGTAPSSEHNIKMHPILRVTHCIKCHDFYNSGEFSKGEDGSELYCRWCGQGGEVYCCSTCPFVFCKSCIVKNLSRGVIVDIEQNENWNCFRCTSKILWPLRAQHWALVNYIKTQKSGLNGMPLAETELRRQMHKDSSSCCRLAKAKASSLSDSMESLESNASKRSHAGSVSSVKKSPKPQGPPAKRPKSSNDDIVCTPDLLSMLEPDCQISVAQKPQPRNPTPVANLNTTPRIVTVQQNYGGPSPSGSSINSSNGNTAIPRSSLPPPLVLSSSGMRYRQSTPNPSSVVRRTVVPNAVRNAGPVFHTINGFRVDLNSAAQQDSYRLPNGRLIQVKRQVPPGGPPATALSPAPPMPLNPQVIIRQRPTPPPRMLHNNPAFGSNMGIYNPQTNQQQRAPQVVRVNNGSQVLTVNLPGPSAPPTPGNSNGGTTIVMTPTSMSKTPSLVRHVFPNTPIGTARAQLQDQIFNAMEICTHLTGKVQTLTHSNAYNQARSYMDLKELYIHLSYLMTYAIGRFKQLQDKCLLDMRDMGFKNDANSLENGQLAAAVDYVCYGQLDDVDLFNTGCNSFHNQVYEYRKSLHANLKDGEKVEPLPPLMPLGVRAEGDPEDDDEEQEGKQDAENEYNEPDDYNDDDQNDDAEDVDDDDDLDDDYDAQGTEESMNRNEQAHAYDRKLTRLLREYPSIWCTQHPDYGKMEVTRKQWRVIASHFPRGDDIKLRWKNVRKRYVRIERLLKQGKRFKGYFDKATNYLANRDRPRLEWLPVDCGEGDGDGFERKQLDAIENTIHKEQQHFVDVQQAVKVRPLEVRPIDQRIINFAKSHPVLWRKSTDPEFNSIDEQTRKSLWLNFWKSAPKKQASDDEDNEIEIVEPKTDTITIDSDNEDESPAASSLRFPKGLKITSVTSAATTADIAKIHTASANSDQNMDIDVAAFSSSILASLLEVDINESSRSTVQKKQPRKKTTNKPNPALLHLERQRMEETKRNDAKLKMKVVVRLTPAEDEFEVARNWIEKQRKCIAEKSNAARKSVDVVTKPTPETIELEGESPKSKEETKDNGEDKKKTETETGEDKKKTEIETEPGEQKKESLKELHPDTALENAVKKSKTAEELKTDSELEVIKNAIIKSTNESDIQKIDSKQSPTKDQEISIKKEVLEDMDKSDNTLEINIKMETVPEYMDTDTAPTDVENENHSKSVESTDSKIPGEDVDVTEGTETSITETNVNIQPADNYVKPTKESKEASFVVDIKDEADEEDEEVANVSNTENTTAGKAARTKTDVVDETATVTSNKDAELEDCTVPPVDKDATTTESSGLPATKELKKEPVDSDSNGL